MAYLIDKSVLVAEIEKRMQELYPTNTHKMQVGGMDRDVLMWLNALTWVKNFLDTLKVKEVDLEKHLKEDIDDVLFDLNGVAVKGATHYLTVEDVKDIAKHFYSLGMATSNKAQKGE